MDNITKKNLLNRLNRAEGQIRALKSMIETDKVDDCRDFIIQIKAARAALKRASEQYVLAHIHHCDTLPKKERTDKVTEAINLLASD
jgi:CsoR family transcriptional regulator, copper-sensing transcriptional repressor